MRRREASTREMEHYGARAPHLTRALLRYKPLDQLMGGFARAVPRPMAEGILGKYGRA
jgi:hypothetical protein